MACQFETTCHRFANAITGNERALLKPRSCGEKLQVLGVEFPSERPGIRVEPEQPRACSVALLNLQKRSQFNLFGLSEWHDRPALGD